MPSLFKGFPGRLCKGYVDPCYLFFPCQAITHVVSFLWEPSVDWNSQKLSETLSISWTFALLRIRILNYLSGLHVSQVSFFSIIQIHCSHFLTEDDTEELGCLSILTNLILGKKIIMYLSDYSCCICPWELQV